MTSPVIYWFRQDLRVEHLAALNAAAAAGAVVCVYILDDNTPGRWRWGGASRWWLHHSLDALSQRVKLVFRQGRAEHVLAQLLAETKARAVYFTRDYAPWAHELEHRMKEVCEAASAGCYRFGGFLLHEPEAIRNAEGKPYRVYSPFARAAMAQGDPTLPPASGALTMWQGDVASDRLEDWGLLPRKPNWARRFPERHQPGEAGARKALQKFIAQGLEHYARGRDLPHEAYTSGLSPHLHWGEISPAQCWVAIRNAMSGASSALDQTGEKFLKEILWREFSYHILHHFPELPDEPFRPEFRNFPYECDAEAMKLWQRGETGYPLVDAGMRELWATGIMHNRVRMVTASFLTKHLMISWKHGMTWFWDTLVDADIANNSASWQWVAGSGADAAPYFRVFNPVLQGLKFDPEGHYIRRWLPELRQVPAEFIHRPWDAPGFSRLGYPRPMIEHDAARDRALAAYRDFKADAA